MKILDDPSQVVRYLISMSPTFAYGLNLRIAQIEFLHCRRDNAYVDNNNIDAGVERVPADRDRCPPGVAAERERLDGREGEETSETGENS